MCEAKKFLPALFNKKQKLCTFLIHLFENIITDEFKTKGNLAYRFARIITKMDAGEELEIYRDWKVDGDRQLSMFKVVFMQALKAYGESMFTAPLNLNFGSSWR